MMYGLLKSGVDHLQFFNYYTGTVIEISNVHLNLTFINWCPVPPRLLKHREFIPNYYFHHKTSPLDLNRRQISPGTVIEEL
jgi:hypothetical protein